MEQPCQVDGCTGAVKSRGWCMNHYMQHYRSGFRTCEVGGCQSPPRPSTGTLCAEHRPTICSADGCLRPLVAKGLCKMHWRQRQDANRTCETCGASYTGDLRSRFCSKPCKAIGMKSPVRLAVESGSHADVLTAVRDAVVVSDDGCWIWQFAKSPAGYGVLGHGGTAGLVHRHVMAATLGRPLRSSEVVHHKCAIRACVSPDHLQLVTQRENMAEMFARKSLERRIMELEAALADLAPDHPLLVG